MAPLVLSASPSASRSAGTDRSRDPERGTPRAAAVWDLHGPGIAAGSRWGYDAVLECWWAVVVDDDGVVARVGADHLIPTVDGLARALGRRMARPADELYLALTAR